MLVHRKAYSYVRDGKRVHVPATSFHKREGPRRQRSNAGMKRGPRHHHNRISNVANYGANLRALFRKRSNYGRKRGPRHFPRNTGLFN